MNVVGLQMLQHGLKSCAPFFKRHFKRRAKGVDDPVDVIGVHLQGAAQFARRAREALEHEHAGIIRVLRGDKFL